MNKLVNLVLYVTFIVGVVFLITAISRFIQGEYGAGAGALVLAVVLLGVNMLLFRFTKYGGR